MLRGGLARRVALLESLRRQAAAYGAPTRVLVGADDFLPDRQRPDPKKTGTAGPDVIAAAYARLKADAGYLSPKAHAWLGDLPDFTKVDAVRSRVLPLTLGDGSKARLVLVFFPALAAGQETAPPALLRAVLDEAAKAAGQDTARPALPTLVVGLSSWGFQAELAALPELSGRFHVLLGAGPGAPLTAEAHEDAPSLLWSRADVDGRGVIVIDLLRLPRAGKPWDPPTSVWAREIPITPRIDADPAVEALLRDK